MNGLTLNPNDIENLIRAVRTANRRGAFEIEESVQVFGPIRNLEIWLHEIQNAKEQVDKDTKKEN